MFFLVFLIPVAFLLGGIYWYDASNEAKIQTYLDQQQCKNVTLYRARYNAVCQDSVIVIKDFFFLDFDSNKKMIYKDINSIEKVGHAVILNKHKTNELKVYFENEQDTKVFQDSVTQKLN